MSYNSGKAMPPDASIPATADGLGAHKGTGGFTWLDRDRQLHAPCLARLGWPLPAFGP
jgi:hypothetical protein